MRCPSLTKLIRLFQSPLVRAIFSGDPADVERSLESHPEEALKLDSEKRSPLHAAAFLGHADVVELLLNKGDAVVDAKDVKWLTPLHRACRSSSDVSNGNVLCCVVTAL